jgi:hypothetical protein
VSIIFSQKTNPFFLAILSRKISVRNYLAKKELESGDLGFFEMEESIPKKIGYLVPPLPLIEDSVEPEKSADLIEFNLKQRAGSGATASTYKIKVVRFCEGTVGEYINFCKAILELWTQNSITSPQDRIANVRAILRGDSHTAFNAKINELTQLTEADGSVTVLPFTDVIVMAGLNAVAEGVFPHRALQIQKQI